MIGRIKRKCFIIVKVLLNFICVCISVLENKTKKSFSPIRALTDNRVLSLPLTPSMLDLQQKFIISPAIVFFFLFLKSMNSGR